MLNLLATNIFYHIQPSIFALPFDSTNLLQGSVDKDGINSNQRAYMSARILGIVPRLLGRLPMVPTFECRHGLLHSWPLEDPMALQIFNYTWAKEMNLSQG